VARCSKSGLSSDESIGILFSLFASSAPATALRTGVEGRANRSQRLLAGGVEYAFWGLVARCRKIRRSPHFSPGGGAVRFFPPIRNQHSGRSFFEKRRARE
jgi:hypothetical protein